MPTRISQGLEVFEAHTIGEGEATGGRPSYSNFHSMKRRYILELILLILNFENLDLFRI